MSTCPMCHRAECGCTVETMHKRMETIIREMLEEVQPTGTVTVLPYFWDRLEALRTLLDDYDAPVSR